RPAGAGRQMFGGSRFGHRSGQGATVWQPYSSGATSRTVSVNCQRWPARSSTVHSRSPYSRSVGGSSTRAPWARARSYQAPAFSTPPFPPWAPTPSCGRCCPPRASATIIAPVLADAHLRPVALADPGPFGEAKRRAQPCHRLPYVRVDEHGDDRGRRDGPVRLHFSLHSSPRGGGVADLPVVAEGAGDQAGQPAIRLPHRVGSGATAAMACSTTGLRVTGDQKRSCGGPAQGLMADAVVVR